MRSAAPTVAATTLVMAVLLLTGCGETRTESLDPALIELVYDKFKEASENCTECSKRD